MDDWSRRDDIERLAPTVDMGQAFSAFHQRRQSARKRRRAMQMTAGVGAVLAVVVGVVALTGRGAPSELVSSVADGDADNNGSAPDPDPLPQDNGGLQDPLTATANDLGDPLTATLTDLQDRLPPVSTGRLGPGWTPVEPAPIAARTGAVGVWTGTEVLLWGGRGDTVLADGAAYNPDVDSWRVLRESPLSARDDAVVVWTGQEMIIFGGRGADDRLLFDAAAYNPAEDSWRRINTAFGATRRNTAIAWTGQDVILIGTVPPGDLVGTGNVISYRPSTGEFESLAPNPREGLDIARRAVTTNDLLIVVQVDEGSDAVYVDQFDQQAGAWVRGNQIPGLRAVEIAVDGVAWSGTELVIVNSIRDGAIYDPATGRVDAIPASRSTTDWPAVMVDGHVFVGDLRFDPQTRQWLTDVSYPFPDREFPTVVGIDGGVFVWGGNGCGRTAACVGYAGVSVGLIWSDPFDRADLATPPLSCSGDEETVTIYDSPDSAGFDSLEAAAADWWENGDGRLRPDREQLEQQWQSRFMIYVDAQGDARVVLRLELAEGRFNVAVAATCPG